MKAKLGSLLFEETTVNALQYNASLGHMLIDVNLKYTEQQENEVFSNTITFILTCAVLCSNRHVHGPASDAVHSSGFRPRGEWSCAAHHHDRRRDHDVRHGSVQRRLHRHAAAGLNASQPRTDLVQHAARAAAGTVEHEPGNTLDTQHISI